jgi:hypothetical protein
MITGISTTKTGLNARFVFGIIIGLFHFLVLGLIAKVKPYNMEIGQEIWHVGDALMFSSTCTIHLLA